VGGKQIVGVKGFGGGEESRMRIKMKMKEVVGDQALGRLIHLLKPLEMEAGGGLG
jgi:hypothetical protein